MTVEAQPRFFLSKPELRRDSVQGFIRPHHVTRLPFVRDALNLRGDPATLAKDFIESLQNLKRQHGKPDHTGYFRDAVSETDEAKRLAQKKVETYLKDLGELP